MKLEQNDKSILFSITSIPDIFITEYLNNMPGDYLKLYLYLIFLSKYNHEVNVNNLSKKLSLSINTISDGIKYLEKEGFILRKPNGYIIIDLQEKTLNNLYTLKMLFDIIFKHFIWKLLWYDLINIKGGINFELWLSKWIWFCWTFWW